MNKFYMFDINLQCIIQRKVGDIRPKDIQSSYFLFFVLWIAWVVEGVDQSICF